MISRWTQCSVCSATYILANGACTTCGTEYSDAESEQQIDSYEQDSPQYIAERAEKMAGTVKTIQIGKGEHNA